MVQKYSGLNLGLENDLENDGKLIEAGALVNEANHYGVTAF